MSERNPEDKRADFVGAIACFVLEGKRVLKHWGELEGESLDGSAMNCPQELIGSMSGSPKMARGAFEAFVRRLEAWRVTQIQIDDALTDAEAQRKN